MLLNVVTEQLVFIIVHTLSIELGVELDPFEKVQLGLRVIINLELLRTNQFKVFLSQFLIAFDLRHFEHLSHILQKPIYFLFLVFS